MVLRIDVMENDLNSYNEQNFEHYIIVGTQ